MPKLSRDASDVEALETAYRSIQSEARAALREHPDTGGAEADGLEVVAPTTTWCCPECGSLDAPQPCLGLCIKRPAEWVNHELYERERARALHERDVERRLRRLMRHIAFVTPRSGHWEQGWRALQAGAAANAGRV